MEDSIGCKIGNFQTESNVIMLHKHPNKSVLFKLFHLLSTNPKLISQYRLTYTLYSGLNHVNYLNIIKRDHVSATVRTRLHLASGWSLDHSGAQYSYVGVRTQVGCRHMISFYNIPPIISVFKLQIRNLPWKYNRDLCSFSHFTFYFHLCMMEFCSVFYNG